MRARLPAVAVPLASVSVAAGEDATPVDGPLPPFVCRCFRVRLCVPLVLARPVTLATCVWGSLVVCVSRGAVGGGVGEGEDAGVPLGRLLFRWSRLVR